MEKSENNIIISVNNDLQNNILEEGKKYYKKMIFNSLDIVMTNDDFRSFYDNYFKDFTDIKVVILYMKLYETIQIEYKERNGIPIKKSFLHI